MDKKSMILALIDHYSGGNKAQFANLLGISPQGLSTWLKRYTFDVELIFAKCEGVSAQWLLTGTGDMINKQDKVEYSEHPNISQKNIPIAKRTNNKGEGIPLIPFSAMAGALTSDKTVLEYECEHYVIPLFKGADFLIPVKGSSMYPKYSSGDIVACQRIPMTDMFFQWNKVYVLDTNQGALIKRIKPGSDNEHILIVSDNDKYDPFELRLADIHAVALVIGVIRLE